MATVSVSFSITWEPEQVDLVPTPTNILTEFDSINTPMGIFRYTGEKQSTSVRYSVSAAREGFGSPYQHQLMLGLEVRSPYNPFIFENTSTGTYIFAVEVDRQKHLNVHRYEESAGTGSHYSKTSFTYDLLNRGYLGLLEDIAAHVTVQVTGARSYIYPFLETSFDNILPEHLVPGKTNETTFVQQFEKGTRFFLRENPVIPDSIAVDRGDLPSTAVLQEVGSTGAITNLGDYYINYFTGEVVTLSSFESFNMFVRYRSAKQCAFYPTSPGLSVINLNDTSVLGRFNEYEPSDTSLSSLTYHEGSTSLGTGRTYASPKVSPQLRDVLEHRSIFNLNKYRYGEK